MREKNALTKHSIADIPTGDEKPDYLRLAKWISTIDDDSDEEVEDQAFYDGDGTPEDDVMSVKKTWSFEGMYDDDDPAMKFVADKEFETGEGRKIMYKQERTNGDVLEGRATLKEIVVTGGEASEYAAFSCSISWDRKPDITRGNDTP